MTTLVEDLRTEHIDLRQVGNAELASRVGSVDAEFVRLWCLGELQDKDADGSRPVLISTDDIDRMGDIVEPRGMDIANFRKNPVVLWAHDYALPPIGSAESIKRMEHGILAKVRWASTEFAQQIKLLYDEGHLRAWSVGFIPRAWEPIESKDEDGQPRQTGRRYTKAELLEFSAVPVPANPNALSLALTKGLPISKDLAELLMPTAKTVITVPADPAVVPCDECATLREQVAALTHRAEAAEADWQTSEKALAAANAKIEELTKAQDTTVRIDAEAIRRDLQSSGVTVDGQDLTREELRALVQEAAEGLIRKMAGVVSR